MKVLKHMAFILAVVGALNWGLVGSLNFKLVSALLGHCPMVEKAVYILIGLSGAMLLVLGFIEGSKKR